MKLKLPKYFQKLIIFGALLGTFPVVVLGGLSYYKSSSIAQDKVNKGNMQVLQQTQIRVEQSLKALQHSYIHFASSSLVRDLMDKNLTYHNFDEVRDINVSMNSLQTFETTIADTFLINMEKDWVINGTGISRFSEFKNKNEILKLEDFGGYFYWLVNRQEIDENIATIDEQTASNKRINLGGVNLVVKVPANAFGPKGLLIISISNYEINRMILKTKEIGQFLVLDEEYHVIASEDRSLVGNDISSLPYIKELRKLEALNGNYESVIGKESYTVNYIKSEYNGWIYISLSSIKEITEESRSIGWLTLAICLIMLIFTLIVSLFGSRKMYNPIRNLHHVFLQDTDTVDKDKDEFAFIGESVNIMKKNQSKLANQLKMQIGQLREFFVLKLLQGEIHREEIEDRLKDLGFTEKWKWLCVISIQIDTFEGTVYNEKDLDLMMFAINNIVEEMISVEQRLNPVLLSQSQVTIVCGNQESAEEFKAYIFSLAEGIQKNVKEYLKLKVSVGISHPYFELEKTHHFYEESIEALKHRLRFGAEAILFIGDIQHGAQRYMYFPKQLEDEFIDAIKLTDEEKANNLLEQLIKEIFQKEASLREYQISLARILVDILRLVQDSGESLPALSEANKSIFDELFHLKTTQEIRNWFKNSVIKPIMSQLEEKRGQQYRNIAKKVINLIHEEYEKDISLEYCASKMNYHPSYIRRILKKENNINFSDYLAQYRLNIAKQWLVETDMTVTHIAEKLRYNNPQNFIRYFRKLEGITPGQYRENNKT